jgi:hypothetical protein
MQAALWNWTVQEMADHLPLSIKLNDPPLFAIPFHQALLAIRAMPLQWIQI